MPPTNLTQVMLPRCYAGMPLGEYLPGACSARFLCIQYLISSPKFILTLGSPPSRPH